MYDCLRSARGINLYLDHLLKLDHCLSFIFESRDQLGSYQQTQCLFGLYLKSGYGMYLKMNARTNSKVLTALLR